MPGVRARDPRREGDAGGARQPERDHPAGGAGRGALPGGVAQAGRRAQAREEEEEEAREEGNTLVTTTLHLISSPLRCKTLSYQHMAH